MGGVLDVACGEASRVSIDGKKALAPDFLARGRLAARGLGFTGQSGFKQVRCIVCRIGQKRGTGDCPRSGLSVRARTAGGEPRKGDERVISHDRSVGSAVLLERLLDVVVADTAAFSELPALRVTSVRPVRLPVQARFVTRASFFPAAANILASARAPEQRSTWKPVTAEGGGGWETLQAKSQGRAQTALRSRGEGLLLMACC